MFRDAPPAAAGVYTCCARETLRPPEQIKHTMRTSASALMVLGMLVSVSAFGTMPRFSFCKSNGFSVNIQKNSLCVQRIGFGSNFRTSRQPLSMGPATLMGSLDGASSDLYEALTPMEDDGEQIPTGDDEEIDPADVRNFPICEQTMDILAARGITKLFPVQAATFNEIYNGRDVLARARTGTGKTLGFALPILERLLLDKEAEPAGARRRGGQRPSCVILSPTRELAQQVRLHKQRRFATLQQALPSRVLARILIFWDEFLRNNENCPDISRREIFYAARPVCSLLTSSREALEAEASADPHLLPAQVEREIESLTEHCVHKVQHTHTLLPSLKKRSKLD